MTAPMKNSAARTERLQREAVAREAAEAALQERLRAESEQREPEAAQMAPPVPARRSRKSAEVK